MSVSSPNLDVKDDNTIRTIVELTERAKPLFDYADRIIKIAYAFTGDASGGISTSTFVLPTRWKDRAVFSVRRINVINTNAAGVAFWQISSVEGSITTRAQGHFELASGPSSQGRERSRDLAAFPILLYTPTPANISIVVQAENPTAGGTITTSMELWMWDMPTNSEPAFVPEVRIRS